MADPLRDFVHQALSTGVPNRSVAATCAENADAFFDTVIVLGAQPSLQLAALTLLQDYLQDYPIQHATAAAVREFAERCRTNRKGGTSAPGAISSLATSVIEAIDCGAYEDTPVALEVPTFKAPSSTAATVPPQFSNQPAFRPAVAAQRARRFINVSSMGEKERGVALEEMNKAVASRVAGLKHHYTPLRIKDYVEQSRITVTQQLVSTQIFALHDYKSDYVTNAAVNNASWILIKVIMDAYVSRISLMANFTFLREVSYAFVNTFRGFVASTFLSVRKHAYNLLASLATHVQLVDSLDAFAGSVSAIEAEVAWLVRRVVEYQYLAVDHDERLWVAALKCCLFTHATDEQWARLHPGALRSMMMIPQVSACQPIAFTRLANAVSKQMGAATDSAVVLDITQHLGGEAGLVELLALAPTVEAAAAICRTIAIAVGTLQPLPGTEPMMGALSQAWGFIEKLRVPWALHLLALAPASAKEFAQIVQSDVESIHTEAKKSVGPMISRLINVVLDAASPPPSVRRCCAAELSRASVAMIREDTDPELRRTGVRLASFAVRVEWWDMQQRVPRSIGKSGLVDLGGPATEMAVEIVSSKTPRLVQASGPFLRRCCRMLTAAHPASARNQFAFVLGAALRGPLTTTNAMLLYRGLLESLSVFARIDAMSGDVSKMMLNGSLAVYHAIVDGGADAVDVKTNESFNPLWALYWALRGADDSIAAVREARHVLIALIANSECQTHSSWQWDGLSGVDLWFKVLCDPYPACAVIGAQFYNRVAAVEHYSCYEAVASEAARRDKSEDVLRNPFLLATLIHARIQQSTSTGFQSTVQQLSNQ